MTLLIVSVSIAGYLAAAGYTARWSIGLLADDPTPWRMTEEQHHRERTMMSVVAGLFWPVVMVVTALRRLVTAPISRWLWQPVVQRQARLVRLEADRVAWLKKRAAATGDDERRMADDVIETLDDCLKRSR